MTATSKHDVWAELDGTETWIASFSTWALAADYVNRIKHDQRPNLFPHNNISVRPSDDK